MQLWFSRRKEKIGLASPLVPGGSFSGRVVLVLRGPDSLRLEPLSPFGAPLMVVVAHEGSFRVYSPSRNAIYVGRTNERGVERILGLPLNGGVFVNLLLGNWLAALGDERNLDFKNRRSPYLLEVKGGSRREAWGSVELAPHDWHPLKIGVRTLRGTIMVRYGAFLMDKGAWRPSHVEITGPRGENRLHISYPHDEGVGNAIFSDELFRLEPPQDAKTFWLGG